MARAESGDFVNRLLQHAAVRRALPHVLAVLAIALFVAAGNWQLDRMRQKEQLGHQLDVAESTPPAPLPPGIVDWTPWRFRVVDVAGRYDAARQILIDNRVYRGRVGYHVVTPIVTGDGRALLVNRGWIAGGATRAERPNPPVPPGEVRVRGRLNLPAARYVELERTAPVDGVWQNLDPARFTQASGLEVLDVVLEQTDGSSDGLVREWPRPDTGADKHRGYMLQWYAFAAMAAGLWGWFTFRRPRSA